MTDASLFAPARYDDIDFSAPKGAREEAQKGLDWRAEYERGGTAVGVARARDIARGANLSPKTIGRMNSYFARHEVDKQGEGWSPGQDGFPSAGRIAWALWGGDPGEVWARKVAYQMEVRDRDASMAVAEDSLDRSRSRSTVSVMRLAIVDDDQATFAPGDDLIGDDLVDEAIEDAIDIADEPLDYVDKDDDQYAAEETLPDGRTKWVLLVEGVETGDGRLIEEGAITWRDLPLPLMATDKTGPGHDGAQLVGRFVDIYREDNKICGISEPIESDDPDVLRLQMLIETGDLRGISVDLDNIEGSMIVEEMDEPTENEDGTIGIDMAMPKIRLSAARIMGATGVPFPAFAEAQQVQASLIAGAGSLDTLQQSEPTSVSAPVQPPRHWFDNPEFSAPTPMDVESDGYIRGHVALWASCHRGFDSCTPPPRAPAGNYEHFHTGQVITADGSKIGVGNITVDSGHADIRANANLAKDHYDNTGWIGADVRCGEDAFGIWMSGAIRSDITPERLRALMATDVSGDWRAIDGRLRLIGLASIPVPGFVKTQVASGELLAMVASVPVCDDNLTPTDMRIADRIALSVGRTREQIMAERDRVAFDIGRHPSQQRAALADRIHGK